MSRLDGKRALVTGSARGIGLAVARAFVAEGARVLLTDIRIGELGEHSELLRQTHAALDVRSEEDWARAMARVKDEFGGLDVLVNNAGITGFEDGAMSSQDPEHADLEDWRAVHATNLDGVFLGCKHAIRLMRECKTASGSIVNIGSRSGVVGVPAASAYASSKSAVRNHTKSVALYCAEHRLPIRCNVVQPAAILTPMWEPMLGTGEAREVSLNALSSACPMKRFGTANEVASLVVHLASDESAYTTGTEFTIDGGMLAGAPPPG